MKKSDLTICYKKSDIINIILPNEESLLPKKEGGLGFAPANIALCKYWGKRDIELNLPVTSSISISLPDRGALTSLALYEGERDEVILNGKVLGAESEFVKRIVLFLDLFRFKQTWRLRIDIKMQIPVAAGLASSAAGFASLVCGLNDLFAWQLSLKDLSILARLGSGSASRSLWPGFVEWKAGLQPDGMDSCGEALPYQWPGLCVGILAINTSEKPLSSREAMQRTVSSSVLYDSWPKKVALDSSILKQAMKMKNFPLLGGTSESNALAMHATMLSSWPPICYSLPETIAAMHKVWKLREDGLGLFFTQDAGPNLKLLFMEGDAEVVKREFGGLEVVKVFE